MNHRKSVRARAIPSVLHKVLFGPEEGGGGLKFVIVGRGEFSVYGKRAHLIAVNKFTNVDGQMT